ncbi:MAG: hypothetical protein K8I00_04810 [Candidatus Omnitrophica bacterium]|nr:hypothetical protein [Candidatus Omnitrophota bacterium]
MSEQLLADWIKSIQQQFADGPPDGKALDWDKHRFEPQIRDFTKPFKYHNRTSFENKYCNTYQIAISRPEEDRWLLLVQISFVVDGYITWWTHYKPTGDSEVCPVHPDAEIQTLANNIREWLNGRHFNEVPLDWYRTKLPGVKLTLSTAENVILGKCLFEDYSG